MRFDRSSEAGLGATVRDLVDGFLNWRVWVNFAREEIRSRFHGSWLGVLWIAISFLIFVLAITLYFRAREGTELLYVAIGMAAYQFLVSCLSEGCSVFLSASGWIQGTRLPYSVYVYKSMARSIFPLIIHLVLCAGMVVWVSATTEYHLTMQAWLGVGVLLLFFVNGLWVHFVFGMINARFRDLQHLVAAITRLLFFTTPILWSYEETSGMRRLIADFNPFTHFVQVFRGPLLGEPIADLHWYVVFGFTVGGWLFMLTLFSLTRHKLTTWLN